MLNQRLIPLVLFVMAIHSVAFAEWYKDYEDALELLKKNRYAEAVPKLRSAIAEKNDEEIRTKFYGMKFGEYFPHYYLGLAYFAMGNYDLALQELEVSESQGTVRRKKDLQSRLEQVKTLARAQLAAKTDTTPATVAPAPPAQNDKQADSSPATNTEPAAAQQAVQQSPAQPPVVQQPQPPQLTPEQQAVENARRIFRNAARRYFQGDYDAAIRMVGEAIESNSSDTASYFLLGCSYASKYLLSGAQDRQLYEKAIDAFQKLKSLRPDFQANSPYISPAVLEIYRAS